MVGNFNCKLGGYQIYVSYRNVKNDLWEDEVEVRDNYVKDVQRDTPIEV